MKLDILAFAAHPDDVELSCAGTIISEIKKGKKAGIIDLTEGELGTRGSAELRYKEAEAASKIMGLSVRENLNLGDGSFQNNTNTQKAIITAIRKYKPDIVLANAITDRHPDHRRGATLLRDSFFFCGLKKIETEDNGQLQEVWKPRLLLHYIQSQWLNPDFVVDISHTFDKKMEAVKAYTTQFYNPNSKEPDTFISSPQFLKQLKARAIELGNLQGFDYAEGFNMAYPPGVKSLEAIF